MKKTIALILCAVMLAGLTGCSTIGSLVSIGRSIMGQQDGPAAMATPQPTTAVPALPLNTPVATVPPREENAYPVLKAAALEDFELETAGNSVISGQFPKGEWIYDVTVVPVDFAIYDVETLSSDIGTVNINMNASLPLTVFTEEYMDAVLKQVESMGAGMAIQTAEMRSFKGENLGYVESITTITDEMLDMMSLTQEQIEQMGGRETLLNLPPTYQVQMYYVVSGKMLIVTGTYYDDAQKDRLIETMTILLQTAEVK